MRKLAFVGVCLALAACGSGGDEKSAAAPAQEVLNLTCGEIGGATRASLTQRFGAENVQIQMVDGHPATVVFPNDPTRRLELTWINSGAGEGLETARVRGNNSVWVTEGGVRLGSSLVDVETANGKPFALKQLDGYGWDGGALAGTGTCVPHVVFTANGAVPNDIWSSAPEIRNTQPVVSEIRLVGSRQH